MKVRRSMSRVPSSTVLAVVTLSLIRAAAVCGEAGAALNSAGMLRQRGAYGRAREVLDSALVGSPREPGLLLARARLIVDAGKAREAYYKIAVDRSTPSAMRAEAHAALGGAYYSDGDFEQAAESYERAATLHRIRRYEDLRALALARAGGQGNENDSPPAGTITPDRSEGGYCIQLGSFAARKNARRLMEDFQSQFPDIRIEDARVRGRTFYRVRIGSFSSEERARRFGAGRLRRRGISYRVVNCGGGEH